MSAIKKKRVAVYVRVSTEDQVINGVSLDAQRTSILRFIDTHAEEYVLEGEKFIYTDAGKSGATENRPELRRLMMDAKHGLFDVVFVWKVDRFFRSTLGLLSHVETLAKDGVGFKSITQDFDTATSQGKMLLGMSGVLAELERDMIRERTITGRIHKARTGFYVGGGLSAKLGYNTIAVTGGKKLEVNEKEAKLVRRIFHLFVDEGKTLGEIANLFTHEGIPTKFDAVIAKERENYRKNRVLGFWYASSISEILKDTRYIGEYYYGRRKVEKDTNTNKTIVRKRELDDPLVVKLECPKILDNPSIFYRAQELLKKNQIIRNNRETYAFTGMLTCEHCGRNYVGYKSRKGTISYRCGGACGNKLPLEKRCHNMQISEEILLDIVWGRIRKIFDNSDSVLQEYYEKSVKDSKGISHINSEFSRNENDLKTCKLALQRALADSYMDNDECIQEAKQAVIQSLQDKIHTFNERKMELSVKVNQLNMIEDTKKVLHNIVTKFRDNMIGISNDKKRIDLIRKFVDRVTINNEKVLISFKFPHHLGKKESGKNKEDVTGDSDDSGRGITGNIQSLSYEVALAKPSDSWVKMQGNLINISSFENTIPRNSMSWDFYYNFLFGFCGWIFLFDFFLYFHIEIHSKIDNFYFI